MDGRTFDRLTTEAVRRPTRRAALRLLAAGLLGGLFSRHGAAPAGAAQVDIAGPPTDGMILTCAGAGLTDCGGECVDIYWDSRHCGACGVNCIAASRECQSGICRLLCGPYALDCGGVCVNVVSDPNNCGGCGFVCPPGQYCHNAVCFGSQCPAGLNNCQVGYCVDLSSDHSHCGVCGRSCAWNQACVNGICA